MAAGIGAGDADRGRAGTLVAGCGKKEFPQPAPSLLPLPDGEKSRKLAIPSAALRTSFYPGYGTPTSPSAPAVLFPHPATRTELYRHTRSARLLQSAPAG